MKQTEIYAKRIETARETKDRAASKWAKRHWTEVEKMLVIRFNQLARAEHHAKV